MLHAFSIPRHPTNYSQYLAFHSVFHSSKNLPHDLSSFAMPNPTAFSTFVYHAASESVQLALRLEVHVLLELLHVDHSSEPAVEEELIEVRKVNEFRWCCNRIRNVCTANQCA